MANGVNTEWFDLQVKFGNYLPKEKEKTLAEIQLEGQKKHEEENKLQNQLEKKNMEELNDMDDDLDFDDQFMRQYMAKRRAQIKENAHKYKYGTVLQITRDQYVKEVTEADPSSYVVIHLYQDYNQFSTLINLHLPGVAQKYADVKFVKMVATKCIEKFPDENVPCFIIYKGGKPVSQVCSVDKHMKKDVNNLVDFLQSQGVLKVE